MVDIHQRKRKIHKVKRKRRRHNPSQEVLATMPALMPEESFPSGPGGSHADPPETPRAFSVRAAWRILCARTGCPVHLDTVYRWISQGRVNSVRMGKRIYIRVEVLDDLVKDALMGLDW